MDISPNEICYAVSRLISECREASRIVNEEYVRTRLHSTWCTPSYRSQRIHICARAHRSPITIKPVFTPSARGPQTPRKADSDQRKPDSRDARCGLCLAHPLRAEEINSTFASSAHAEQCCIRKVSTLQALEEHQNCVPSPS